MLQSLTLQVDSEGALIIDGHARNNNITFEENADSSVQSRLGGSIMGMFNITYLFALGEAGVPLCSSIQFRIVS